MYVFSGLLGDHPKPHGQTTLNEICLQVFYKFLKGLYYIIQNII